VVHDALISEERMQAGAGRVPDKRSTKARTQHRSLRKQEGTEVATEDPKAAPSTISEGNLYVRADGPNGNTEQAATSVVGLPGGAIAVHNRNYGTTVVHPPGTTIKVTKY
jgi:hypothetical protein